MRSNSTSYVTRHLITSLILVVFLQTSESVYADNNQSENETGEIKVSNKTSSKYWGFKCLGIYSGIVFSNELDAGFGIGVRLPRKFFYPSLELTSSMYFWGATKERLDVSTLGIEESLTLIKSHGKQVSLFSGITVGYYTFIEKFEGNTAKTVEHKSNSFKTFLTTGTTYSLKNNHSIFTQINYSLTQNSNELHILIGINFL